MSNALSNYTEAKAKANSAYNIYRVALHDYRARITDEATFLAAQAVYKQAQADFDAAYAIAATCAVETEELVPFRGAGGVFLR